MGMQTLLLYVFVKWFQFPSEIAPFAGLIITIPITFIVSLQMTLKSDNFIALAKVKFRFC